MANLFSYLGDLGQNLFDNSVFGIPAHMEQQRRLVAQRQAIANMIGQPTTQPDNTGGVSVSNPSAGGIDLSGYGVNQMAATPAMHSLPSGMSDAQLALARMAVLQGKPDQAWGIAKPPDPFSLTPDQSHYDGAGNLIARAPAAAYNLGPTDTRLDGDNRVVAHGTPADYTLDGPTGSGQVRYRGANDQPVAGFTSSDVNPNAAPGPASTVGGTLDPATFFKQFVLPHEGGFNPHDANGSPTNYGINQKANPQVDVRKLTPDAAADIFAKKYYAASGAENLPPALAAVHADTYFINPAAATRILAQAQGDPQKYMQLREAWMQQDLANNPNVRPYAKAWANRNRDLLAYAQQIQGQDGTSASVIPPPPSPSFGGPPPNAPMRGGNPSFVSAPRVNKTGHASTPQELQAANLPSTLAAWTDATTGKIEPYPDSLQPPPPESGLSGEEFLKTLPTGYARTVQAYANGDLSLPTGNRAGSRQQQKLLSDIMQYDPSASALNLQSRNATRQAFTSGKYSQTVNSANTVVGHLAVLQDAAAGLHNTGLDWVNGPAQWLGQHFGNSDTQAAVAKFNTARTAVANELTTVFRGSGGAEADVQNWLHQLDSAKSPAELNSTITTMAEALKSRLEALASTYSQGMGRSVDPFAIIQPDKQAALHRILGERGDPVPYAFAPTPSAPQGPPTISGNPWADGPANAPRKPVNSGNGWQVIGVH